MQTVRHVAKATRIDSVLKPLLTKLLRAHKGNIVVFFDFDDVLALYADGSGYSLRGGNSTRQLITWLNKHKIPWFVNTARGPDANEVMDVCRALHGMRVAKGCTCIDNTRDRDEPCFLTKFKRAELAVYDNIVSSDFQKAYASEFVLQLMPCKPSAVVFIDDNAINLAHMVKYMRRDEPLIDFYGILHEPTLPPSSSHVRGMRMLENELRS